MFDWLDPTKFRANGTQINTKTMPKKIMYPAKRFHDQSAGLQAMKPNQRLKPQTGALTGWIYIMAPAITMIQIQRRGLSFQAIVAARINGSSASKVKRGSGSV